MARDPDAAVQPAARPASLADVAPAAIPGALVVLALPMLGEQFINFTIGLIDTWLAGRLSKEATAAVGTGAYFGWFTTLGFSLVSTGVAALAARAWGMRDGRGADRVLAQGLLLALVVGLVIAAGVFLGAPAIAALLAQTAESRALCVEYLRIDAWSYTAASLTFVGAAALRSAGDTRTPLLVMIGVSVINAVVSMGLVFGWFGVSLGVTGIVIGTLMARWLGAAALLALFAAGRLRLRLHRSDLRPQREMLWRLARIGGPGGIDASFMFAAQILFITIVAHSATGAAATANFAAHVIAMRLEAISFLPAVAWMTAAAAMVGQYLGAQRPQHAARAGHVAAIQGMTLTTLVGAGFYFGADLIYRIMSNDDAVRAVGAPAVRYMAFLQPFLCAAIVYTGVLRGAGDTRATMVISFIGGLLTRVPLAYLGGVVLGGGLLGAWLGMFADNIVKAALGYARFVQGGWQRLRV